VPNATVASSSEAETVPPPPSAEMEPRTLPPLLPAVASGGAAALCSRAVASTAADQVAVPGYEILGELGRGGMGVVYQARHVALNRVEALKMVLAGGHAGEHELARFQTEAEAVARLQHPNIVQIHEVGESDGKPFFSLEFCAGGSLAAKLGGTPLPPQEAARLVELLAGAMHAAHQAGIIHRDLKPQNILLTADGTPKVTDFGLAKNLEGGAGQTGINAVMRRRSGEACFPAGDRGQPGGHSFAGVAS
jgi:serine/threonine-protein kinase